MFYKEKIKYVVIFDIKCKLHHYYGSKLKYVAFVDNWLNFIAITDENQSMLLLLTEK